MALSEEITRLNREFEEARSGDEARWHATWDDVYRYLAPTRQRPENITSPEDLTKHIYDSTGMDALRSLAGNIISSAMPQWSAWAMLAPHQAIQPENAEDPIRDDLIRLLTPVNAEIATMLHRSNFYAVLNPFIEDFIIGTGCMGMFADADGHIRCRYYSPFEYSFNVDSDGRPLHVYIEHKLNTEALVQLAEDNGMPFPQDIVDSKLAPEKRQTIAVRQVIMPDSGRYREIMYVKCDGIEHTVRDSMLDYHPIHIARWAVDADNRHGIGPGAAVYPDVRYLNVLRSNILSNLMLNTTGVFTGVDDGILNPKNVKIRPGSVVPVMSNDSQNPSLRPLQITNSVDASQYETIQLRNDVRKQMYMDRFSEKGDSKLSPTEVIMRAQALSRELGPAYSQLQHEFMNPVIRSVVKIAQKFNRIPREVNLDAKVFEITYMSQLEQAQRMGGIQNVVQLMQMAAGYMEVDQGASLVVDYAAGMRELAEAMQVPVKIVRSPKATKAMMKEAVGMAQGVAEQNANAMAQAQGGSSGGNTQGSNPSPQ